MLRVELRKKPYFPGPEHWQIELSRYSPKIRTSGMTQPAAHAIAALEIYKHAKDIKSAKWFLKEIYSKIMAFHRYLFDKRDPEESGLITIIHPWESGLDNSVRWDEPMMRIPDVNLPEYRRTDLQQIREEQRPSSFAYDRFIYLLELMKNNKYEESDIYKNTPFKIKDIVFSSITYVANKALLEIATILGEDRCEIESWIQLTRKNYLDYFSPEHNVDGLFYDYDLSTRNIIKKRTIASLIPIFTDIITNEQARKIVDWMQHAYVCDEECVHQHPVTASMSLNDREFDPLNYWRGPIWINMNWMIYHGLRNHGFHEN
jgi:hypothetical protein